MPQILGTETEVSQRYCTKKEEKKKETDNTELCSLRTEMIKLCETLLAEKQHSEALEKELDELRSNNEQIIKDLQEVKASMSISKSNFEKMSNEKHSIEIQLQDKVKEFEKMVYQLSEKNTQLQKQYAEVTEELKLREQEISEIKKREEDSKNKINQSAQKLQKEVESKKNLLETLEKKNQEINQLQEKKAALQKRIEKETKTTKRFMEERMRHEELIKKYKAQVQQTDNKLSKAEKDYECVIHRLAVIQERLEEDKIKNDRLSNELEEAVTLLKQTQMEKLNTEKEAKKMSEALENRLNNKIMLLEKKCEYLKKMNGLSAKDASKTENNIDPYMKEYQESLLQLMNNQEELSESLYELECHLVAKERELQESQEKLRQMEDLLNSEYKKKINTQTVKGVKTDQSKKILQLEKWIDEILVEVAAEGIQPSKMNSREKAMIIVEKIQENKKELARLLVGHDFPSDEITEPKGL